MAETQPPFDLQAAHKYFSAHCFNSAWDLIEKSKRTMEEDITMLQRSLASLWHWTQRQDAKPQNLSVGYWQVARVYTLLGQVENALAYGAMSLKLAEGLEPFYSGFAYEALARAQMVAGNRDKMNEYLEKARALANQVEDEEDKQTLIGDLETIK
jgi:hypothetical protein